MKKIVIENFYNLILRYNNYSDEEKEKLLYGLEGLYLTITKLVVIIMLAILFKIIKEVALLILLFNVIRYTGFGFHAEKSYQCLITSIIFFFAIPLLFKNIVISNYVINIIFAISLISFILYAPADTIKRPIYERKLRIIRKVLTIIIAIIYFIGSYNLNYDLKILFIESLIIESIIINPLFYKLFKQPYRNYKTN